MFREQKWRRLVHLGVVAALATAAAACGSDGDSGGSPSGSGPSSGQTDTTDPSSGGSDDVLTIAVSGDIGGWDPATTSFWLANEVVINTHDTLIDYGVTTDSEGRSVRNPDEIVPHLAESWEVSDDGLTYTFKLREGVKFNNGDPLTAQAVKDSFVRLIETPGLAQFLLTGVIYITEPDQITVVDDLTVSFTLPDPNPMFLKVFQEMNMAIVNVNEIKANGATVDEQNEWAAANPTGTGPYVLDHFTPGQELVLVANPNYWGEAPAYSRVIYRQVADAETRKTLLMSGDVDIAYEPAPKDMAELAAADGVNAVSTPTFGTLLFQLGGDEAPWDDPLLKQALAYAIPAQDIIDNVMYGLAIPSDSWVSVGLAGHIPASPYQHDLDKAAELLAEAGYPDGKGLPPIQFALRQGSAEQEQAVVFIQAELAKIGVTLNIDTIAAAAYAESLDRHELPFTFAFFIPYVPDAAYQLFFNYHSSIDGCCNYQGFGDPAVDAAIDGASTETDPAKRIPFIETAQELIAENPPQVGVYHPSWNIALRSDVSGYTYWPDTLVRFATLHPSN